jgi:hypothetical protein
VRCDQPELCPQNQLGYVPHVGAAGMIAFLIVVNNFRGRPGAPWANTPGELINLTGL